MPLPQPIIQQIGQQLSQDPDLLAAYLLGSAMTANFRPDSDLDLALLPYPGRSYPLKRRLALAVDLQDRFGYLFDIGLLCTRQLVYTKEALTKGYRLFCRDEFRHDLFAATALSCYAQLRHERREIENGYTHG